jgi:polyhydroxyalkanoate synthesis repressor PhaR
MTTLIKRYSNRKLYNTETSRYITLKGIAELIEHGDEVRVIDNETGEDITSIALSQILVDSERSQRAVPGSVLSDLIQKGGDALYGALRRGVEDASDGIGDLQRNVRRAIKTREDEAQRIREAWGETRAEWRLQGARPAATLGHRRAEPQSGAGRRGPRRPRTDRQRARRPKRARAGSGSERTGRRPRTDRQRARRPKRARAGSGSERTGARSRRQLSGAFRRVTNGDVGSEVQKPEVPSVNRHVSGF